MEKLFDVNIGRQLGSGGHEIGKKIATKLNISFYDKELITLASEKSGLCVEFFEKADEEASKGIIGTLSNMHIPFINESAIPGRNCLSNDALFKVQSEVIQMLAAIKSCVFIGRCADYILRENRHCINIFITADIEDRIKRIQTLKQIKRDAALNIIEKSERKRADYYNYYTTKTWGSAESYDLCINSSIFGIDKTVEFLCDFISMKLEKDT